MKKEDRELLNKINDYANIVLDGVDPQKVQVSFQLDKLKPIMVEIATETNMSVEEVFIKYMDLASEASVENESVFQEEMGSILKEDSKSFR